MSLPLYINVYYKESYMEIYFVSILQQRLNGKHVNSKLRLLINSVVITGNLIDVSENPNNIAMVDSKHLFFYVIYGI